MALLRRFLGLALLAVACQRTAAPAAPAAPAAGTAGAATPTTNAPPSQAECEALYARYHALAPDDPYVEKASFVLRCQRSERAVLTCPERASDEVREIVRQSRGDAGPEPDESAVEPMLLRVALPSRHGICMARERVRHALRTGELGAIAAKVASGALHPGEHGVVVLDGDGQTLPSRGIVEGAKSADLAPAGEVRVVKRPDGRVFVYVLGALLGRHQNQVGFMYASKPFVAGDFDARDEICLEPSREDGAPTPEPKRYMLACFTLVDRLAPQLVEVGGAPD